MFHGSSFFNFGAVIVLALTVLLLLSSVKARFISDIKRWQKEDAVCRTEIVSENYYQTESGWQQ